MEHFFQPDYLFDDYGRIPPELLRSLGTKLLLCDIDNTLVTYDDPVPTEDVLRFFEGLREQGIHVAFLSNNNSARVERFNEALGFHAEASSGKPFTVFAVRRAMKAAGSDRSSTVMLGDQIFTDVLAARLSHIPAILVRPIRDKKTKLFLFKRRLERPFLRNFKEKYGKNSEKKLKYMRIRRKRQEKSGRGKRK